MNTAMIYLLAADTLLILHVLSAAFIVIGLFLIFLGKNQGWPWVRNPWFRLAHVAAISVVTFQSWFGVICPLTIWEKELRSQAGQAVYSGSFISHLLETILYFRAPTWVFAICYTVFGAIVIASWIWVRPRPFTNPGKQENKPGY
ncbi:MAG: DUF2784 family protein [Desulforhopalus sp.]|nr:DUF2784 family protein [Desulforhopalus sp.]